VLQQASLREICKALLHKLGANCSYPTALCHIPPALFGLGLPNLYWEQHPSASFSKLAMATHLLLCSLEQAQLQLGISTPFFQADFSQYGFLLTECWVKFLWSFLAYSELSLFVKCPLDLGLQQVDGQFLTEILLVLNSSPTATWCPSTIVNWPREPSASLLISAQVMGWPSGGILSSCKWPPIPVI